MCGKGRSYSDHDEQVSEDSILRHQSVIHGSMDKGAVLVYSGVLCRGAVSVVLKRP